MLTYFRCPDGVKRPIKECLERCPRKEGRCLALSHLIAIGEQRVWNGTASVTQLINPTRLAYLTIVKDYAVKPDDMAFMLYGTLHHKRLEIINKRLTGLAEHYINDENISGTFDRLEPDELQEGFYKLIDYKFVGAYSVARALGLHQKNGETADPDAFEWELQLNRYRMLIESDKILAGIFPISKLLIQATVRDSGLRQINSLKLPCRMPLIPIKKLDDDLVNDYFMAKDLALHKALETKTMPDMCDFQGRWGGRRCSKQYCFVNMFCPEGAMINKVKLEV